MRQQVCDYIIVGAGSAGCAAARRLADAGKQVLLLEAGGSDRSWKIRVPSAIGFADLSRFDWGYRSEPDPTRGGKSEACLRGRVLGGSSSTNGMNYVRGSAAGFDRWAAEGNAGWDAASIMGIYRDLEACDMNSIPDEAGVRGRHGPVHIRQVKDPHSITTDFLRAAQAAGFSLNPDYNGPVQEGFGYAQLTQSGRKRWSAADAFLHSRRGNNIRVVTGALVERITFSDRRALGIEYVKDGKRTTVHGSQIILSCGAINTPKVLMLSGIGDGDHLAEMGISPLLNMPAVGSHLMEHPVTTMTYEVNKPTYNSSGSLLASLGLLGKYLLKGQGPIASAFEANGFIRSSAAESEPDLQIHFAPVGLSFAEIASEKRILKAPSISLWINKSFPRSRGRVRLQSGDPRVPPRIELKLLGEKSDVDTLVDGVGVVRRIMSMTNMSQHIVRELRPGPGIVTEESIREFITKRTALALHFAGTCRMGLDDEAVVDPQLKVRGVEGLWIADASIMPELTSGNTNAICMAIGDKLGRLLASS